MKRCSLMGILLLIAHACAVHALSWNVLNGAEQARLLDGEILGSVVHHECGAQGGRTIFAIRAHPDSVWQALSDFERSSRIFADGSRMQRIHQRGDSTLVSVITRPLLGARFRYRILRIADSGRRHLRWHQTEGDFKLNQGSWEVQATAHPDIQLVIHHCFIETRMPLSGSICSAMTVRQMKSVDTRLRQWLQERAAVQIVERQDR